MSLISLDLQHAQRLIELVTEVSCMNLSLVWNGVTTESHGNISFLNFQPIFEELYQKNELIKKCILDLYCARFLLRVFFHRDFVVELFRA